MGTTQRRRFWKESILFFGKTKTLSPIVGYLSIVPVKKSGLGILNPVTSAQEKYLSSKWGSVELVWAVTGVGEFSSADHLYTLGEEICDGKKEREAAYETKLNGLVCNLKDTDRRLILRAKSMGDLLVLRGTKVSGTVLSATEFRDFLCARYNVSLLNLLRYCDGCGKAFGVTHILRCITGRLVIARHK